MASIYKLIRIFVVFILVGIVYSLIMSDSNMENNYGPVIVFLCYFYAPANTLFILFLYFSKINRIIVNNLWLLLLECIAVFSLSEFIGYIRDHFTIIEMETVDGLSFPKYKWFQTDVAIYLATYIIIFICFLGARIWRDYYDSDA